MFDMSYLKMRQWYVVYSKSHKEEFAQFHLRQKGLEVFFPRLLLPESVKGHRRIVALFPNYLFVRFNFDEEYQHVLWSPGVKRLVSFNGTATPIDEEILTFLMKQSTSEGIIGARSNLKVGQKVQINGGPFEGLAAIIQEPPNTMGRVKVLLTLLSRQVKAEIPVQFVESNWVVAYNN